MRKFLALLLVFLCLNGTALAAIPEVMPEVVDADAPVEVPLFPLPAKAGVLIERTSGRVLYGQNENEILPIASTTKVMTALLAIEHCAMDEVVTAGPRASGIEGTSIYLSVGEQLPMLDMLYGLMLRSGNDAAVAIAEHIDGTESNFAERMNRRAVQLGANAKFVTANGLDKDGNGASALGITKIAAKALSYPLFRQIVGTKKKTIPWPENEYDRELENKNRLLSDLPGATGVKTGFTSKAGRCLVFSCERNGMELVGAVLNCGTWFDTAMALMEWGFEEYTAQRMWDKGAVADKVRVEGGRDASVEALYAEPLTLPLAGKEQPEVSHELFDLKAPVVEGQLVGYANVTIEGKPVVKIDLVAANDVEPTLEFWEAIRRVIGS